LKEKEKRISTTIGRRIFLFLFIAPFSPKPITPNFPFSLWLPLLFPEKGTLIRGKLRRDCKKNIKIWLLMIDKQHLKKDVRHVRKSNLTQKGAFGRLPNRQKETFWPIRELPM
jgi:hypothetical protein